MSAEPQLRWYCRSLGDGLLASVPLNEIRQAFTELHPVVPPPDAAVFVRHRLEGLQCEVTVFFSPALAGLARRFGAHQCYLPNADEVALLAGSPDALGLSSFRASGPR